MILACSFEMTNSFFLLEKNLHGGKGVSLRVPDSPQRVKTTTPRKMATTTIAERLQQPCETRLIAGTSMFQQTIRNTTALQCLTLRSIHPIESFQLAFRLPIANWIILHKDTFLSSDTCLLLVYKAPHPASNSLYNTYRAHKHLQSCLWVQHRKLTASPKLHSRLYLAFMNYRKNLSIKSEKSIHKSRILLALSGESS